jgi:glutamate/aspartate transport system substrate-binding protein
MIGWFRTARSPDGGRPAPDIRRPRFRTWGFGNRGEADPGCRARCALHPGYGPGVVLGLIIAVFAFAAPAAAQIQTSQVETDDPGVVSGTLARIKKTGIVRLGYRDASIPFSFLDPYKRPVGYSIDICKAIVREIGRTLDIDEDEITNRIDYVKVTSETRLPAVMDGTVDLECG